MASAARLGPPQSRGLAPSIRQVELFMGRLHYRCYDSSLGDDAEAGAFCTCGTPAGGTRNLPRLDDAAPLGLPGPSEGSGSLRRPPERRLRRLEARRGLRSPPPPAFRGERGGCYPLLPIALKS